MTLNEIKELIYKRTKKMGSFNHAILICSIDSNLLTNASNEICRLIFCENNSLKNDDCIWCKKVISQNSENILFIGDGEETIKKSELVNLIKKFSTTSIEENLKKIYVINKIENIEKSNINTLLKFIEEPPNNVYCILLANNINSVLPTIKSRTINFNLSENTTELIDDKFVNLLINNKKEDSFIYLMELKKKSKNEVVGILRNSFKSLVKINKIKNSHYLIESIDKIYKYPNWEIVLEEMIINYFEDD